MIGPPGRQAQRRARLTVVVPINLTPLVDVMTMLVLVLLTAFYVAGEPCGCFGPLALPRSLMGERFEAAPVVIVNGERRLFVDGEEMGDVATTRDRLLARQAIRPGDTVILEADRSTDVALVRAVLAAAAEAGYPNAMLAVVAPRR